MDRLAAIRDVYREWERGNYRAGLELYDPEFEVDGDRVVVHVHHGGLGRASGVRTEMTYFTAWTFQEDRVTRVDIAQAREVALRS